jgi:tetratricopeptide (TPR) repeat protein
MNRVLVLFFVLAFLGCSFRVETVYFEKAVKAEKEGNYPQAISDLKRVIEVLPDSKIALEAAQKGAFLARTFTEDYGSLLFFLNTILLGSSSANVRIGAQREIADIFFENLANYPRAIEEYSRLLPLSIPEAEKKIIQLKVARAYYFMGQFQQALYEIEAFEKSDLNEDQKFDAQLAKANIFTGQKKYDLAIEALDGLLKDYPQRAKSEKLLLNLAVCYEEKKEFEKAIEKLLAYREEDPKESDFIDLKIERLRKFKTLLPGAQGMKK